MPQNSGRDYKARQVDVAQPVMAGGPVGGNQGGDYIQQFAPEIARCDATREGSSQDYESTTMVAVGVHSSISHTLKAERADASEGGTGRETPIIAFNARQDPTHGPVADALGTKDTGHGVLVPAVTVALRDREGGATAELGGEVATALRASNGGGDKPHVLYAPETYPTLSASEGGTLTQVPPIVTSAVRRLTPVECERLQGFPDNYTAIPWRGKSADLCPDGPRYKALGNSWAVPLFTWLGRRIDAYMPPVVGNNNRSATTNKDTAIAA